MSKPLPTAAKPQPKPPLKAQGALALTFAEQGQPASKRSVPAPVGHKRLTINLPEDLHKRLRIVSAQRGVNATDIITALLVQELGE